MTFTEGSVVRCGHCGTDLYTLTRDVTIGSPLSASLFAGEPVVCDGVPNPCQNCGREWFYLWLNDLKDAMGVEIFRKTGGIFAGS